MHTSIYPADRIHHRNPETNAVFVRPVSPGDEESLRRMLSRLSRESLYMRFHAAYPRASKWAVATFANPDRQDGESIVAVADGEIIGHGMYVLLNGGGDTAEFAIVVEDGWQARGVGKLLLSALAERARRAGVETFTGAVLGENRRMLGLVRSIFLEVGYAIVDGAYDVSASLRPSEPVAGLEALDVARPLGLSA
ncbi:MAG: GNAT family N-acetyltransferase [Rubrobacteraceae bacterium]|nr:GNAT family N-acetyltransferase [Rubrobacter sp.]